MYNGCINCYSSSLLRDACKITKAQPSGSEVWRTGLLAWPGVSRSGASLTFRGAPAAIKVSRAAATSSVSSTMLTVLHHPDMHQQLLENVHNWHQMFSVVLYGLVGPVLSRVRSGKHRHNCTRAVRWSRPVDFVVRTG